MAQTRLKITKIKPKKTKIRPKMGKMKPKMAKTKPKMAKIRPTRNKMTPIEKTTKKHARRCVCMHAFAFVATLIDPTAGRRQDDGETKKQVEGSPERLTRAGLRIKSTNQLLQRPGEGPGEFWRYTINMSQTMFHLVLPR